MKTLRILSVASLAGHKFSRDHKTDRSTMSTTNKGEVAVKAKSGQKSSSGARTRSTTCVTTRSGTRQAADAGQEVPVRT